MHMTSLSANNIWVLWSEDDSHIASVASMGITQQMLCEQKRGRRQNPEAMKKGHRQCPGGQSAEYLEVGLSSLKQKFNRKQIGQKRPVHRTNLQFSKSSLYSLCFWIAIIPMKNLKVFSNTKREKFKLVETICIKP